MFVNTPVQNGEFTFADRPGKAVGIRIAAALSTISGTRPAPHLWNIVTLAGDLRYRAYAVRETRPRSRVDFENMVIAAKYPSGAAPPPVVLTDADEQVAALALEMIEARLSTGALQIRTLTVRVCAGCAHMTGAGDRPCRACGHPDTRPVRARHLVADRDPDAAVLVDGDFSAHARRQPAHLRQIAGNVPPTLIMSRTRDHGIDLAPIGLDGLVLDPRAGIHVTVMAAARARQAERAVMTTTANAAANVAAYGRLFFRHDGRRLLYALHGHIPYDHIADLRPRLRGPGHRCGIQRDVRGMVPAVGRPEGKERHPGRAAARAAQALPPKPPCTAIQTGRSRSRRPARTNPCRRHRLGDGQESAGCRDDCGESSGRMVSFGWAACTEVMASGRLRAVANISPGGWRLRPGWWRRGGLCGRDLGGRCPVGLPARWPAVRGVGGRVPS